MGWYVQYLSILQSGSYSTVLDTYHDHSLPSTPPFFSFFFFLSGFSLPPMQHRFEILLRFLPCAIYPLFSFPFGRKLPCTRLRLSRAWNGFPEVRSFLSEKEGLLLSLVPRVKVVTKLFDDRGAWSFRLSWVGRWRGRG